MTKNGKNTFEGKISINSRGVGFVGVQEESEDIEIPEDKINVALHGDTVLISKTFDPLAKRPQGKVEKVIKRAKTEFVGTIKEDNGIKLFIADYRKIHVPFAIDSDSKPNTKVLVKLVKWDDPKRLPEAKILETIGTKGDHNTEMNSIILDRGFSPVFPENVEEEAKRIKANAKTDFELELKKRKDFRSILTFTIDPNDAKDFDDAISIQKIDSEFYEIGVHIADVSHFVRPKTSLDDEAQKRATSIYLVDRTIPMLPEILSNDLCSLNPMEDKLAYSSVFEINLNGEIRNSWFGRTIINSNKRFTYEEAQESILGKADLYKEELQTLNKIAKKLESERAKKGAISFDQDEVKFELDQYGKPIRVLRKVRFDAHKLVEEFMLLANREVASHINKFHKNKSSLQKPLFLYRIHDVPDYDKIAELSVFVKALGYELPINKGHITGKDLNALFKKLEGEAEEGVVKTAAIRSMAKAIYSTKNIGHFGLAFDYYTHFTSPIRRYPDVLVHRLLTRYLNGESISSHEFAFYENMASKTTEAEIRAADAERESIRMKQVEFMQSKIGLELEGIISGVTEWGMYIEEKETKSEGMVRLRNMKDDYYRLDQRNYCLIGEKTKKKYTLGDKVKFTITAADPEQKTLDLKLLK